jgi:hypothetical protein
MTSSTPSGVITAILPCNNLDASERFYNRLGFKRSASRWPPPGEPDTYRMLANGRGGYLHLTDAVEGWLVPGRNPFGLYLYLEDVDALAAEFQDEITGRHAPEDKPSRRQAFQKASLGECTNLPSRIRIKRWFASAGRPAFADRRDAAIYARSCFSISWTGILTRSLSTSPCIAFLTAAE